jgi:hypothetical protein
MSAPVTPDSQAHCAQTYQTQRATGRTNAQRSKDRRLHPENLCAHRPDERNQIPANQFSPCLLQNVSRNVLVTSIALIHFAFL